MRRIFRLRPEYFFLCLAVPFHFFYSQHFFAMANFTHAGERFLHVVSRSHEALGGGPDTVPSQYLQFVYRANPKTTGPTRSRGKIENWRRHLGDKRFLANSRICAAERRARDQRRLMRCLSSTSYSMDRELPFRASRFAADYPLAGYLPYLPGVMIAMAASAHPMTAFRAGEASALVLFLLLGFFTVRWMPFIAWPVAFLLLLPSMFAMRGYYMADGIAIGLCWFFVALVLHWRARGGRMSRAEQAALLALSGFIGLVKVVFFLIPALLFLLPAALFRSAFHRLAFIACGIALSLAAALWWNVHAAKENYPVEWRAVWDASAPLPAQAHGARINERYARRLLQKPVAVGVAVANTWVSKSGFTNAMANAIFWNRYLDDNGGRRQNYYPKLRKPLLFASYVACLLLAAALGAGGGQAPALGGGERVCIASVALATAGLIGLTLFLFWGTVSVNGVLRVPMLQGRYFLPILPLFLLLAPPLRGALAAAAHARARIGLFMVLVAMTLYFHYLYQLYF